MITGAAAGLALLAAMVGGLGLLLHNEASALRAGACCSTPWPSPPGWHAGPSIHPSALSAHDTTDPAV